MLHLPFSGTWSRHCAATPATAPTSSSPSSSGSATSTRRSTRWSTPTSTATSAKRSRTPWSACSPAASRAVPRRTRRCTTCSSQHDASSNRWLTLSSSRLDLLRVPKWTLRQTFVQLIHVKEGYNIFLNNHSHNICEIQFFYTDQSWKINSS